MTHLPPTAEAIGAVTVSILDRTGTSAQHNLLEVLRMIPGYDPVETAHEDMYFDLDEAERAASFFPDCLTHEKGELRGKPFYLEPGQAAVILNLFGWKRRDGRRRYDRCLLYVARKWGKTILAAGICNYLLFCDGEPGAEIYAAAAEKDQATILWTIAKEQIKRCQELRCHVNIYRREIVMPEMGSNFKPVSSDAETKHGFNPHGVVLDELHAQKNDLLLTALETAMGARRQPLFVLITTADYARESPCNREHDIACKVRDGIIDDPSYLPVIYETPSTADWTDPKVWKAANPHLGISVSFDYIERQFKRAQENPVKENDFKRFYLNMKTEQAERIIVMSEWDACGGELRPTAGRPCYGGLDLATINDLASFVLVWPDEDGSFDAMGWAWCPRVQAEIRTRRERFPYMSWAAQKFMTLTDGEVIDYDVIRKDVKDAAKEHSVVDIGYDPWNAEYLCNKQLREEDGLEMVQYRQGTISYNEPFKLLLRLLKGKGLRHAGNPVGRWMASNLASRRDQNDNLAPCKKTSGEKIDWMCALLMALGRALASPGPKRSVYEDRGVLQL